LEVILVDQENIRAAFSYRALQ